MSNSAETTMHIKDIVALILKEKKITEGFFVPMMELSFGTDIEASSTGEIIPAVKIGIKSIGIQQVEEIDNEMVVDASKVNPKRIKKNKTD